MEPEQKEDVADLDQAESSKLYNITMTTSSNISNSQSVWIAVSDLTPETIIVPCVFTIILVVGVVGNTLLILSFARHKTLSTPHNALVVNLASGDFIFLIVSLPFNMIWYAMPSWPFGLVICKLTHFAEILATTVVISTLSVLSVERCLIVTGKKLWRQQKRGPIWLTISIWTVSLLVSIPSLISSNLQNIPINNTTHTFCFHYGSRETLTSVYSKVHVACMFIFLLCLPLLIIAIAYILIAVHLLLRSFPLSQRNSVKLHKPKPRINHGCCFQRKSTKNDITDDSHHINTTTQVTNSECRPKENVVLKPRQENIIPLRQQLKSEFSAGNDEDKPCTPAKEDGKACSPDSYTETTELQQTPMLPYSFVYTGPVPTDAISKHETSNSKMNANVSSTKERSDASGVHTPAPLAGFSTPWKETSPLNPSSSGDAKPAYQQRQQSLITKRRKLALTVLMLIIAFAVCWIPRHIYLLWFHFLPDNYDIFWHVFKIIGFCLSSSNSAVNPVVFYILDTTYRSFVHRAICMICMKICRSKTDISDEVITLGERDYNATIAVTDTKSKALRTDV